MDSTSRTWPEKPKATFVTSYAAARDMPELGGSEFALLGRSNVGKSSFINHVFSDRKLAKTSKTPGKTRLANVFNGPAGTIWVDLPGYGYATAGRKEKAAWSRLILEYCRDRAALEGIVWLLDIRHPGTGMDKEAARWLNELDCPILPVLTKGDKLSANQAAKQVKAYMKVFRFAFRPVVFTVQSVAARDTFWKTFCAWASDNGVASWEHTSS